MDSVIIPIKLKDLPIFHSNSAMIMLKNWLAIAEKSGVNIGELSVNSVVYNYEEPIFTVEYIKMLCNLSNIFRTVYDNNLYQLRLQGLINDDVYSKINYHNIFNEINNTFNFLTLDGMYIFEEMSIYDCEISLELTVALYDKFNESIISELKNYVDPNLLLFVFNKINMKHLRSIYDSIQTQFLNVFTIY